MLVIDFSWSRGRAWQTIHECAALIPDIGVINKLKSAMSTSNYAYAPLSGQSSIRLLEFAPAKQDASRPLSSCLIEHDLETAPFYIALSYAWEGQKPSQILHLKEQDQDDSEHDTLLITQNCEDALRRFLAHWLTVRDGRKSPFRIWVDAVCIDQSNNSERSHQVSIMGAIYSSAGVVWVWLGREVESFSEKYFSRIARRNRLYSSLRSLKIEDTVLGRRVLDKYLDYFASVAPGLASRPYWSRVWTLQELALARSGLLFYGNAPPVRQSDLIKLLDSAIDDDGFTTESIATHFVLQTQPKELSKIDLLVRASSKLSTDPRDKIYATRGLSLGVWDDMTVDYDLSYEDVYHQATVCLLNRLQDLSCLERFPLMPSAPGRPTWVLDWNVGNRLTVNRLFTAKESEAEYSACSKSQPQLSVSDDNRTLRVHGMSVDTIEHVSARLPPLPKDIVEARTLKQMFDLLLRYSDLDLMAQLLQLLRMWLKDISEHLSLRVTEALASLKQFFLKNFVGHMLNENGEEMLDRWLGFMVGTAKDPSSLRKPIDSPEWIKELSQSIYEVIWAESLISLHWMLLLIIQNSALFVTHGQRIGLSQALTQPGDQVVLVAGMDHPVILRRQNEDRFQLLGIATVGGAMHGELWPENVTKLGGIAII